MLVIVHVGADIAWNIGCDSSLADVARTASVHGEANAREERRGEEEWERKGGRTVSLSSRLKTAT